MKRQIVICLDGCGPDYLALADTPELDALARGGLYREVQAVVPTVTNVNNASIVTSSYPEAHGITSNFYRDRTGREQYIESADFLLRETIFQRVTKGGRRSALLTVKDKLRTLLDLGATVSFSAEDSPPAWLAHQIGPPPSVYSLEVNHWLMMAMRELLRNEDCPDFFYVSTTDYGQHKYAPEDEPIQRDLWELDMLLGQVFEEAGDADIVVTADHGMGAKTRALDLACVLREAGINGEAVPVIKDRYVAHHSNLGGAAYVHLGQRGATSEAMAVLQSRPCVEGVLTSREAALSFHLHPRRIGDLFVLATDDTVFGDLEMAEKVVSLRSHGSLHERAVPLVAYGRRATAMTFTENKDATAWVGWD
jgi:phosphonoacetate hydrolase